MQITRSRNTSTYNQSMFMQYMQGENEAIKNQFIPFLQERDSMNRLFTNQQSPQKQIKILKKEDAQAKWKQNIQNRFTSPIKRHIPELLTQRQKKRSYSNARNLPLTERQLHDETDRVEESIEIAHDEPKQIKIVLKKVYSQKLDNQNNKLLNQDRVQNIETKQSHIKLPLLRQRQYVDLFLQDNQKIADIIKQKDEEFYKFPSDFELRIIQMKRSIRKMKQKVKNWDGENKEEHIDFLREAAHMILNKIQ